MGGNPDNHIIAKGLEQYWARVPNPWEVRTLPGDAHLEVWGGDAPAPVMAQGGNRIRVELAHVKGLVAGLVDGVAELTEVLAAGGTTQRHQ